MARIEITLSGDNEINHALQVLGAKIETRILSRAFRQGAKTILTTARQNLRVIGASRTTQYTRKHTLQIARKLKVRVLRRQKGRMGVSVLTPTRAQLGIAEGGRWYYPAHIELGTQGKKALPFLRNAFDDNIAEVGQEVIRNINAEIQRALG